MSCVATHRRLAVDSLAKRAIRSRRQRSSERVDELVQAAHHLRVVAGKFNLHHSLARGDIRRLQDDARVQDVTRVGRHRQHGVRRSRRLRIRRAAIGQRLGVVYKAIRQGETR